MELTKGLNHLLVVDFEELEIKLNRGVVHQVFGELKTEASHKPIPMDPDLAQALLG
jgi:hypothetical protein